MKRSEERIREGAPTGNARHDWYLFWSWYRFHLRMDSPECLEWAALHLLVMSEGRERGEVS